MGGNCLDCKCRFLHCNCNRSLLRCKVLVVPHHLDSQWELGLVHQKSVRLQVVVQGRLLIVGPVGLTLRHLGSQLELGPAHQKSERPGSASAWELDLGNRGLLASNTLSLPMRSPSKAQVSWVADSLLSCLIQYRMAKMETILQA